MYRKAVLNVFVLLFVFFGMPKLFSISNTLTFSHKTYEQGLPPAKIFNSIVQDTRGFIWMGSEIGLHMFDGYGFENYSYEANNPNGLASHSVFAIHELGIDTFLIATNEGFNIFYRSVQKMIRIPAISGLDTNYSIYYKTIAVDREKKVYISGYPYIYNFDPVKKCLVKFEPENFPLPVYSNYIFIDSENTLWALTHDHGAYSYNLDSKELRQYVNAPGHKDMITSNDVLSVCEDKNGNIWLGTNDGLNIIEKTSRKITKYKSLPGKQNPCQRESIRQLFCDNLGNIWICHDMGGLSIYDSKKNQFFYFTANKFVSGSILGNKTGPLFQDDQNTIWFFSEGEGLNYINLEYSNQFSLMKNILFETNSLGFDKVSALCEDINGNIWIGTDGGGLDYFDPEKMEFKHYRANKSNPYALPSEAIISLLLDHEGVLWIGSFNGGLSSYNREKDNFTTYRSEQGEDIKNVYSITELSDNELLVLTLWDGALIFNKNQKQFSVLFNEFRSRYHLTLDYNCGLKLNDSTVLLGTYNGLYQWDMKNSTLQIHEHRIDDTLSISNNWVYTIYKDTENNIWIGTGAGLNLYDPVHNVFQNAGFGLSAIMGIIEDKNGFLWISTNNGIYKYDPSSGAHEHYSSVHGIPNFYNKNACIKDKNDKMYFGSEKGLLYFDPDVVQVNSYKPPVYIVDFQVLFNKVPIQDKDSPLSKHIMATEKVVLKHNQRHITFIYTALNYLSPKHNQYAYKMEGFDKQWNFVGDERKATYSSLAPGEYVFRVRGANHDGVWNNQGRSVSIVVLAPWWKTTWFRILLATGIAGVLILFYFLRFRALNKQKLLLETKIAERTFELRKKSESLIEANNLLVEKQSQIEKHKNELLVSNLKLAELNNTKDKMFSILAHDLKAPFNSILGFGNLLINNIEKYPKDKIRLMVNTIVNSADTVYHLLENLLNWSRSKRGVIEKDESLINISDIIKEGLELLRPQANEKGIRMIKEFEPAQVITDPVLLGTVFRNILSNAIKYSNPDSSIHIKVHFVQSELLFSISDSGVGIPAQIKDKLFQINDMVSTQGTAGERGTGLGLLVCADFIKILGGKIWVESVEGHGSIFYFSVPVLARSM
jgi:signal transduction histidine kinase/ligand-binding sensor domain-containing protein